MEGIDCRTRVFIGEAFIQSNAFHLLPRTPRIYYRHRYYYYNNERNAKLSGELKFFNSQRILELELELE